MNHIRLYDLFRKELHLNDDKAAEAVFAIQGMAETEIASKKDVLATKEDIYSLKSELNKDIQDAKDSLYRAIFLSGIVQFVALTGSLLEIIKWIK